MHKINKSIIKREKNEIKVDVANGCERGESVITEKSTNDIGNDPTWSTRCAASGGNDVD